MPLIRWFINYVKIWSLKNMKNVKNTCTIHYNILRPHNLLEKWESILKKIIFEIKNMSLPIITNYPYYLYNYYLYDKSKTKEMNSNEHIL